MKKYILASASPRRKELLSKAGISFEIIPAKIEENTSGKEFSYKFIESVAEKKADAVLSSINDSAIIISADTVVILEGQILGKPRDYNDALNMLNSLNGKTHKVVSALCVIDSDSQQKIIKTETSKVTFNKLKEEEIENYIKEYKPYDKAGSYGIQELPKNFVSKIEGEYDNIVGLPMKLLDKMLKIFHD